MTWRRSSSAAAARATPRAWSLSHFNIGANIEAIAQVYRVLAHMTG